MELPREHDKIIRLLMDLSKEHDQIFRQWLDLYKDLFFHDGYAAMGLEMRFLKRGQKEIIIHCGKDFRFVVDFPGEAA